MGITQKSRIKMLVNEIILQDGESSGDKVIPADTGGLFSLVREFTA